jgi:hypothetical protein
MVTSGSSMTPTPKAAGAAGVKGREATGRLALDAGRPGSYPQSGMDDPEVTMPTATVSPTAARGRGRGRCRCSLSLPLSPSLPTAPCPCHLPLPLPLPLG